MDSMQPFYEEIEGWMEKDWSKTQNGSSINDTWVRQVDHAFLGQIPKKKVISSIPDNRHIAYYSILYKVISKVLANRLKILPMIISENQGAFMGGRSMIDCALLVSEFLLDFNLWRISQKHASNRISQKHVTTWVGRHLGGWWKTWASTKIG